MQISLKQLASCKCVSFDHWGPWVALQVGNLERMPEMITEAGEAGTSFQQFLTAYKIK